MGRRLFNFPRGYCEVCGPPSRLPGVRRGATCGAAHAADVTGTTRCPRLVLHLPSHSSAKSVLQMLERSCLTRVAAAPRIRWPRAPRALRRNSRDAAGRGSREWYADCGTVRAAADATEQAQNCHLPSERPPSSGMSEMPPPRCRRPLPRDSAVARLPQVWTHVVQPHAISAGGTRQSASAPSAGEDATWRMVMG